MTHVHLSESSVSYRVVTHDRKGREGKGREVEGKRCRYVSCGLPLATQVQIATAVTREAAAIGIGADR